VRRSSLPLGSRPTENHPPPSPQAPCVTYHRVERFQAPPVHPRQRGREAHRLRQAVPRPSRRQRRHHRPRRFRVPLFAPTRRGGGQQPLTTDAAGAQRGRHGVGGAGRQGIARLGAGGGRGPRRRARRVPCRHAGGRVGMVGRGPQTEGSAAVGNGPQRRHVDTCVGAARLPSGAPIGYGRRCRSAWGASADMHVLPPWGIEILLGCSPVSGAAGLRKKVGMRS